MAQNPLKTDDFDVPKDKTLADLSPADLKKAFENASTVETVKFTYAGNSYAVDLHEQHREEFYEVMRKYVDAGRPDEAESKGGSSKSAVIDPEAEAKTVEGKRTREWSKTEAGADAYKEAGVKPPSPERGRVSEEARKVYRAAGSPWPVGS